MTITTSAPTPPPLADDLERLLRRLRLPYIRKTAPEVLAVARSQRWEPAEALRVLLEAEAAGRDAAQIRTLNKRAGFPQHKTFATWNETASSIPEPTQAALRTLEWISRNENLVVCGPSGTGKSHFLEALGAHATAQRLRVSWFSLEDLGVLIRRHRPDDSITKTIHKIVRDDLVAIDDIGLLPVTTDAAEGFLRLVDAAYEKRSIAVSSNLHPSGFDELFPKTIATAAVDRLLHHAHIVTTDGDSYRLTDATTGQGVTPLT